MDVYIGHALRSARLGGQSLRYVAQVEGQWVALLTFSGAAPHPQAREHKIRWTPRQRARRRCFGVNHSRFLVLPERQRYPNLVSRVVALGLKRLHADGQQLLEKLRAPGSARENGAPYRRDVRLGEDASRIRGPKGASVRAPL